ncbi:MAG: S1C family serine protease [Fibrobacterota bacterium]
MAMSKFYRPLCAVLLVVCGLLLGRVILLSSAGQEKEAVSEAPADFSRAASAVKKSVVGIIVTRHEYAQKGYYYDYFRNRFRRQYGSPLRRVENMGSGIIIDSVGHVLTSYHVVQGAQDMTVSLSDGTDYPAELVGLDSLSDLAVIRIKTEGKRVSPVSFADSDSLTVGQWALALGNPYLNFFKNADPTVTVGVISALHRNFKRSRTSFYHNMIQTDAAINPGNSGGPLINFRGDVIGINAFIYTGQGESGSGSIGIGFAIPSNRAVHIARELIRYGRRRPAYTGMVLYESGRDDRFDPGLYVRYIDPTGPAAGSGLRMGDKIRAIDSRKVHNAGDLKGILVPYFPGDTIEISYERGGRISTTDLVLGQM